MAESTNQATAATANVDQVAQALNLTPRRVQQLVQEGMPQIKRGQYNLGACMLWYIRHLQKALERRSTSDGETVTNLTAERTRQARAQAQKFELENARRRGELVLASYVEQTLFDWSGDLVGRLKGLPGRVANEFAATTDAQVIRRRLIEEVNAIRDGSSQHIRRFADRPKTDPAGKRPGEAESPPKRKRVGRRVSNPAARNKRRARAVQE